MTTSEPACLQFINNCIYLVPNAYLLRHTCLRLSSWPVLWLGCARVMPSRYQTNETSTPSAVLVDDAVIVSALAMIDGATAPLCVRQVHHMGLLLGLAFHTDHGEDVDTHTGAQGVQCKTCHPLLKAALGSESLGVLWYVGMLSSGSSGVDIGAQCPAAAGQDGPSPEALKRHCRHDLG